MPHQLDNNGTCGTCQTVAKEVDVVECYNCRSKFHADECNKSRPFCTNRQFLDTHIRMQKSNTSNFQFICTHCLTRREHNEASSMTQQIAALVEGLANLTKEVQSLKQGRTGGDATGVVNIEYGSGNTPAPPPPQAPAQPSAWENTTRTNEMKKTMKKFTLCIKSNEGSQVDAEKIKNIVTANGIKVSKASVNKKNNDMYVDLPSEEQRQKLIPLLSEEVIPNNKIVNVKQKCPTISIRGVENFISEEELIARINDQNTEIKEKLENGSQFSVVYTKEQRQNDTDEDGETKEFQVVARVSDDIRSIIKANGDKIFLGFKSLRVVDRFYVKSCSKCHKFGHYHADCTSIACCGFCCSEEHDSQNCPIHQAKDHTNYKCINCKNLGKPSDGHSSHWHKCPAFLEVQKKMMKNIPYYSKNEMSNDRQERVH